MATESDEERWHKLTLRAAAVRYQLNLEDDSQLRAFDRAGAEAALAALEEQYTGLREFIDTAERVTLAEAGYQAAVDAKAPSRVKQALNQSRHDHGQEAHRLANEIEESGASLEVVLNAYATLAEKAATMG